MEGTELHGRELAHGRDLARHHQQAITEIVVEETIGSRRVRPVNYHAMTSPIRTVTTLLVVCLLAAGATFGSAYNAHPKLVVVIVIDQFRGDYLERYRDQFGEGGFRLFLDRGAYFTDCNYRYANTRTAPGHATLFTGAYSNGHGIAANEWWDPGKKHSVTSVEDDSTKLVGIADDGSGASPHNLMASTLGDELKLATQGKSHVFSLSLKDRAAILPGGFAADAAYWVDQSTGRWITSTYYRKQLPGWVEDFNSRTEKELKEGKDSLGKMLPASNPKGLSSTPFANQFELEFARELILYEHLGNHPSTDLMAISLSPNDILGHQVGPDAPEIEAMALALDKQLADFFNFLGHHLGLANVWIALSADHGIAPLPSMARKINIAAANLAGKELRDQINAALNARLSPAQHSEYVKMFDYPLAFLDDAAFRPLKMKEAEAERMVGEALDQIGLRGYFTKSQLAQGAVPDTELGHKFLNSYSPEGGWYVMGIPVPYTVGSPKGTDHGTPYSYDTHVPLAFYGLAFQPGVYRQHSEPVDLSVTLASLLGIDPPTHAVGRVLVEALAGSRGLGPRPPASPAPAPLKGSGDRVEPAALSRARGGAR